ncbi:hypothetical protein TRFO_23675 [Tritrichomonas foetus]|uniref:Uncharacterized protein n=1 Tax=Tritrichomonas foetus TaxID=1144522 RepID=A0A1J4K991_9EUKA|nr:hypothetical protein TRFO_23675 [Tritrichomonas foetus]|eukprot:OHT07975.1 hypothetical protein TRFO_23675 [Tritrichomonas foetus]
MLSQTSTSWFVCNPEFNKLDIPDDDALEIHQTAIDTSDSPSTAEDVEFSVDSEKLSSDSNESIDDDYPTSPSKSMQSTNTAKSGFAISGKTFESTLNSGMTNDLELLSTIHYESSKRVKRTEEIGQSQRSQYKYTYFSTSESDEDSRPSQHQVVKSKRNESLNFSSDDENYYERENSSENDEICDNENNNENMRNLKRFQKKQDLFDRIKAGEKIEPSEILKYKFKNYNRIKPISSKRYDELNSKNSAPREPPPEIIKMKSTKVRMPADYMEFNERRHPKKHRDKPTLMSGTKQIKPDLSKSKSLKKSDKQIFENYRKRSPPKPHDSTQDRPDFISYKWKKIPNKAPNFVNRPPEVKIDKEKIPQPHIMYKERKIKHMPHPEPEPIQRVHKYKIPNKAPSCVRHPEKYAKKPRAQTVNPNMMYEGGSVTSSGSEEKYEIPNDRKSRRKHLKELLEENEVAEWEIREAPKSESSDDFDDANDFTIPDEFLTNEDEGNDFVKAKPVYYDPHETKAVRLRNQSIKQKLAIKDLQKHLEEEDEDEREWKRKKVSREIAPALKKLEAMSAFQPEDINVKIRRKEQDNNDRAVEPLCAAIRSAKNTEFIVQRETKINNVISEKNGKKHQKEERRIRDEEEKLKMRSTRNKQLLQLWKI